VEHPSVIVAKDLPMGTPDTTSRRGDTLFVLFSVLVVLFILGMSVGWVHRQQVGWVGQQGSRTQAYYLAMAGIEKSISLIRSQLEHPLVFHPAGGSKAELQVNENALNLLDVNRARVWARIFDFKEGDIFPNGKVRVVAELLEVSKNEFSTFLGRVEKSPPSLEMYREKMDDNGNLIPGAQPLGGWSGHLKLTSTGTINGPPSMGTVKPFRSVVEVVKDVQVVDLSCPAQDHTLFIHGEGTESLKTGTFILSNLTLPYQIVELIHYLTLKINEFQKIPGVSDSKSAALENVNHITRRLTELVDEERSGSGSEALRLIHELSQYLGEIRADEKISQTVDDIILSLDPRDWGRVRTNGSLHVYLPFFSPDDIINYFSDANTPAHVGYHNCFNRLHDPYLSVYTYFEGGQIFKHYRRLDPIATSGSRLPTVVLSQKYTVNTHNGYHQRYPELAAVPNLKRLEDHAPKYASRVFSRPVTLFGTKQNPIRLEGLWYSQDEVRIGGCFTGRGLIVTQKGIVLTGNLVPTNPKDRGLLALVALGGSIDVSPPYGQLVVEAGLYARDGLRGTKNNGIKVFGNLSCENLNREKMPKYFECRFNPRLKNHMADIVHMNISTKMRSFRILSNEAVPPEKDIPIDASSRTPLRTRASQGS